MHYRLLSNGSVRIFVVEFHPGDETVMERSGCSHRGDGPSTDPERSGSFDEAALVAEGSRR